MSHVPMCLWCGEREVVGMYSHSGGDGFCSGLCEEECMTEMALAREEFGDEPREDQFRTDAEADADVLTSAGWGTDEDYGYYGESEGDF